MPSNSSRAVNVREIERAIDNIEHIEMHIARVIESYANGAQMYANNGQELPKEYSDAAELLDMCMEGCETLSETLKGFLETL